MRNMEKSRGSKKYKDWRKGVLERDGHKCSKCKNEKNLHCDHIKPWKEFPELRFDIENGQTLCAGCHLKKGRESKEITNDVNTRFKKGQIGLRKGIKTGKPSWNSGKKGLQVAWNKGKQWTDEVKKKVSISRKGKCLGNKFALGLIAWNKGKKNVQEAWNKGISPNDETKKKISESLKGNIPWNKGKKGAQIAWNKGIKANPEHIKKMNEARKAKNLGYNG